MLHLHTLHCTNGFLARINHHTAVLHICLMVAVMVPSLKSYVCINRALACLPEQSSETDRIILEKILVFLCLHKESSLHLKLCIMMWVMYLFGVYKVWGSKFKSFVFEFSSFQKCTFMSAPERSSLASMRSSSVTSPATVILLVWIWKILRLVFSSGSGNSILRSILPAKT